MKLDFAMKFICDEIELFVVKFDFLSRKNRVWGKNARCAKSD